MLSGILPPAVFKDLDNGFFVFEGVGVLGGVGRVMAG